MNPLAAATLIVVLCHPLGPGFENCEEKTVVGKIQAPTAGKVDDPIPMPDLTAQQCNEFAEIFIIKWLELNPQYETWSVRGWKCPTDQPLPSHKG